MRTLERIAAWGCVVLLAAITACGALPGIALAGAMPDMARRGSISGVMTYEDSPVGGGCLEVYQVGDVTSGDEGYVFCLVEEFEACEVTLDDLDSPDLAETLAVYALETELESTTVAIDSEGYWEISDLDLGLYLVLQNESADGYEPISPFITTVPYFDEDVDDYIYDISANPKMGVLSVSLENPVETEEPVEKSLPKTGQLNWPVPVLAILGIVIFAVGYGVRHGGKERVDAP